MATDDLTAYREAACEAARRGAAILEDWRSRFQVREKGRFDLVTDADLASQRAISSYLLERFPDHAFLGEEEVPRKHGPPPTRRQRGFAIHSTAPPITSTIVRCIVYPSVCKSPVNWSSARSSIRGKTSYSSPPRDRVHGSVRVACAPARQRAWRKRSWPRAFRQTCAVKSERWNGGVISHCGHDRCAAPARRRSTWRISPPGVSMVIGHSTIVSGTWPAAWCWCARLAASSPMSMARRSIRTRRTASPAMAPCIRCCSKRCAASRIDRSTIANHGRSGGGVPPSSISRSNSSAIFSACRKRGTRLRRGGAAGRVAAAAPTWMDTAVNLPLRDSVFTVTDSPSFKSSRVIFLPSRVMAVSSGTAMIVSVSGPLAPGPIRTTSRSVKPMRWSVPATPSPSFGGSCRPRGRLGLDQLHQAERANHLRHRLAVALLEDDANALIRRQIAKCRRLSADDDLRFGVDLHVEDGSAQWPARLEANHFLVFVDLNDAAARLVGGSRRDEEQSHRQAQRDAQLPS